MGPNRRAGYATDQNKSSWRQINAGVPQGTKFGPLFFLVMINDLQTNIPLYKYVDDCSTYEIVSKSSHDSWPWLQANINTVNDWTNHNNMRLNVSKTKEMRISITTFCIPNFSGAVITNLCRDKKPESIAGVEESGWVLIFKGFWAYNSSTPADDLQNSN